MQLDLLSSNEDSKLPYLDVIVMISARNQALGIRVRFVLRPTLRRFKTTAVPKPQKSFVLCKTLWSNLV